MTVSFRPTPPGTGRELPRLAEALAWTNDAARRLSALVCTSPGAGPVSSLLPWTGEPLAELPQSTPQDVQRAAVEARAAAAEWREWPVSRRAEVLLPWHDLVLDRQDEALDLVQLESGKARLHAFEEVADVANVARHYARRGPALLSPQARRGLFPGLTRVEELHHPKGLVGIISPWNYPLSLGIGDALPALVAGNAVLTKPDTQTALTALWAVDLLHEAGLPRGVLAVVLGDGPVIGPAVVDHADYVSFTGSTPVGREVAGRAGQRLVGASLELGGKNALIVLADADLGRAAEGTIRACFSSAGQLCISSERVLVAEPVADRFTELLLERMGKLRLGPALDFSTDIGSLVGQRQLDRVTSHVDDALARGAVALAGGRARPDLGPYFYEPTLLTGVTTEMACHDEETFGPVASLATFRTEDEAVARANATSFGLNASVWSRDADRARQLARRLRVGTVNVNEAYGAAWGSVDAPMGGWGDSGLGRRHGSEGLVKYTESQTIAVAHGLGLGVPRGLSARLWTRTMTAALRAMRRANLR